MFFGRARLLREISEAVAPQRIVVGPRRVGKSSLLKQLYRHLSHREDIEAVFLDIKGISDPMRVARRLGRTFDQRRKDTPISAWGMVHVLKKRFDETQRKIVILVDEADGLIKKDASHGYPLLWDLRSLQSEDICAFVLTGFRFLYEAALDKESPLFNFATVSFLGPLEPVEAEDLVRIPMQRLGISFSSSEVPRRIVKRVGGFPQFVQLLCDQVLNELRAGELRLTVEHVKQAEHSSQMRRELLSPLMMDKRDIVQIATYVLLEELSFSPKRLRELLEDAIQIDIPIHVLDRLLLMLVISGIIIEDGPTYRWAMPLMQDLLRESGEKNDLLKSLIPELSSDPSHWLDD